MFQRKNNRVTSLKITLKPFLSGSNIKSGMGYRPIASSSTKLILGEARGILVNGLNQFSKNGARIERFNRVK
jgi:hypothetical protein